MHFLRRVGHILRQVFDAALRAAVAVVLGTILLAAVIAMGTAVHVWAFARADSRTSSDTIFVLGAAQYNGRPSQWLAARLDHAATLYQQGIAPTIVTVGGSKPGDHYTEAEAGKNYLVEKLGIPGEDIVAIGEGVDTLSSAQAFQRYAQVRGWSSAVVVTDTVHSLRATTMVEDQGLKASSSPTRHGPSIGSRATQLSSIVHETGGMLFYRGLGRERG